MSTTVPFSEQGSTGFMGHPAPQEPGQAAPQPAAPTQLAQPPAAQPPRLSTPYDRFIIPKSTVENSIHWRGSDRDLIFGIREPTGKEANDLAAAKMQWEEAVPKFIVMIGDMPVTDYTQALVWWEMLTSKARSLVTQKFVEMLLPTDKEGESLSASRTRVG